MGAEGLPRPPVVIAHRIIPQSFRNMNFDVLQRLKSAWRMVEYCLLANCVVCQINKRRLVAISE